MARVTVEDCIKKVNNRFELVLLATQRARELSSGALPTIPRDNDKNPVIALREIAVETVKVEDLRLHLLASLQRQECGFSSEETHDAELLQVMENEETSYLNEDDISLNENTSDLSDNDDIDEADADDNEIMDEEEELSETDE